MRRGGSVWEMGTIHFKGIKGRKNLVTENSLVGL
jgi:hypothetical protein